VDKALPLVRDVLDKQIHDVNDCKVGKVDGIVLALRANRPPRVIAIELDQATAWRRVHRKLGDLVEWIERQFEPGAHGPVRILFAHVVRTGIDVDVDIDSKHTRALAWEDWLEEHVIAKIPGGRRGGRK
jgi:hypothetical protein